MGLLAVQDRRAWFKSSYSNGAGGECVECAHAGDDTLIRDSKVESGPTMSVRNPAWRDFVRALRQGSLNR
ncbi:DUF397 domain-containing protein [Streptomyces mirabilis]|uniref:DUF397 domain-containing protein n=1 Tax=Streptomyces mirabilis TaxID=68239 RepID=UPI0022515D29|nr:DUF397 domain-containing protein [Streptomyces mirabilis]MCX4609101.1 DUF397 domain-containing protein [Streptomyces mirabilis]